MRYYGYKLWLLVLKGLIYTKRLCVWGWQRMSYLFGILGTAYKNTLGFRLYKGFFLIKKKISTLTTPVGGQFIELLGKRSTLQVVLFIIAFIVMIPHSKLYTKETIGTPGRGTLMYKLVGPGDQDFAVEEVGMQISGLNLTDTPGWTDGAVMNQLPAASPILNTQESQHLAGITMGGSALTKPTIISGIPGSSSATGPANRIEVLIYTVQSGDTIGGISEKYGLSLATVLWANNMTAKSSIRPGDTLKILPTDGVIHVVKKGETVGKIAKLYKADTERIIEFNRLQNDGSDIVIGEELIVPGGEKPAPVPTIKPRTGLAILPQASKLKNIVAPPGVVAPAGSGFIWPSATRIITQYFGPRHDGLDIAGKIGTPNYASKDGVVTKSQCGWNGGYGCYIVIDHGGGVSTLYGHNSQLFVSVGEHVVQGQTIALLGSTGRSTGPHVHFEVRINGRRVNPFQYVR